MNLTENEKRMIYQAENTGQAAILNELVMTCRYTPKKETKKTFFDRWERRRQKWQFSALRKHATIRSWQTSI